MCKRGSLIDCQSVAQSRHSRFLGLPLSVYASAYFSAFSFFTLIGLIALPEPALVHTTLAQVNVLISPIVLLYSLISQIQVRKLCFYCLFILLVLIIMTVLLLPILTMTFKTVPFLFVFGCLYFVFLYLWYREERYIQT
ncbi:vitamin K epoxide reductase family protein, partial [Porphyromonas levii]|uniref:vitamin K epoxide reductase family protein n=1 Tax=Porphyromonas levii TaxID=28114 RepID=UPI0037432030